MFSESSIQSFSLREYLRQRAPEFRWHRNDNTTGTAASRIAEKQATIALLHKPKFKIPRGSSAFTIGSCFARNVEEVLQRSEVHPIPLDFSVDAKYMARKARPNAVLNRFNVLAMYHELELATNKKKVGKDFFIEVDDGKFIDPLNAGVSPSSLEFVSDLRAKIIDLHRRIQEAEVVFFTLGLSETWVDTVTSIPLNQLPDLSAVRRHQGRFGFYNLRFVEAYDALKSCVRLIWDHFGIKKIIFTVSPVPLIETFSGRDVIVANEYSKSVLRIAAEEVAASSDHIDYYPSYEMARAAGFYEAYMPDCRHVKPIAVEQITNRFVDAYIN